LILVLGLQLDQMSSKAADFALILAGAVLRSFEPTVKAGEILQESC
jgi:hypothetical protein